MLTLRMPFVVISFGLVFSACTSGAIDDPAVVSSREHGDTIEQPRERLVSVKVKQGLLTRAPYLDDWGSGGTIFVEIRLLNSDGLGAPESPVVGSIRFYAEAFCLNGSTPVVTCGRGDLLESGAKCGQTMEPGKKSDWLTIDSLDCDGWDETSEILLSYIVDEAAVAWMTENDVLIEWSTRLQ